MVSDPVGRSLEAAITPMVASFGPWGVVGGFVGADGDGTPVVWLRTATEIQRVALQAQEFLLPQVQVLLTRLGVPHAIVWDLRLEMTSDEAQGPPVVEEGG